MEKKDAIKIFDNKKVRAVWDEEQEQWYIAIVDVVAAGAIACQHTLDGNFSKLVPLPACAVRGVVKNQFNTGAARRFPAGGAIENHILHGLATQFGCL